MKARVTAIIIQHGEKMFKVGRKKTPLDDVQRLNGSKWMFVEDEAFIPAEVKAVCDSFKRGELIK